MKSGSANKTCVMRAIAAGITESKASKKCTTFYI